MEGKVLEIVEPDIKVELEQFASKLFNVKASYKTSYYSGIMCGKRPLFEVHEIKSIKLHNTIVLGVAIVQDPAFIEIRWSNVEKHVYKEYGKYIVIKADAECGYEYHLLTFQGEPQLQLLEKLRDEYIEEMKRGEEELRKIWLKWFAMVIASVLPSKKE